MLCSPLGPSSWKPWPSLGLHRARPADQRFNLPHPSFPTQAPKTQTENWWFATRPHADLGCSAVTDEVDGDLAQESQVTSCRPIPDAAVILTEGDIQDPMEPIFDGPVPANFLDRDLGVIAAA